MPTSTPIYQLKRRARLLARTEAIALHEALDRVAAGEGFTSWSLLSARAVRPAARADLLRELAPGDRLLIGARPGQGKTRLGLRLLLDAARDRRRAVLFTLDSSEREATDHVRSLDAGQGGAGAVEIVATDDICAASIARYLSGAPRGTVAVIDYLQILDQQRSKPPLSEQVGDLRHLARSDGLILGFISQIDRSFDGERAPMPGLGDVRLPNPADLGAFSKACFLHGGAVAFHATA